MKKIRNFEAHNKLEKRVKNILLGYGKEANAYLEGVLNSGCQSGTISELIYFKDTKRFFNRYKEQISELLQRRMEECGITSVKEFLRDWDLEDPLALDVYN